MYLDVFKNNIEYIPRILHKLTYLDIGKNNVIENLHILENIISLKHIKMINIKINHIFDIEKLYNLPKYVLLIIILTLFRFQLYNITM